MSQYFEYNNPIKVIWRKGDEIDPYPPLSDTQKIINNTILLTEIPDEFNHVSIEGYAEIYEGKPEPTQFRVDYRTGVIFFNSSEEGKTVIANYFGRGQILSPATRVYIHNENPDVVETLQDMIDDGKQAIDALGGINTAIEMAQTLETELDNNITTGNSLHTNLQDDINQGNTLETELETTTIPNSVNAKANLETTITTANDKDMILNSTINDANTTKLNLDNSISAANTTKTNLNGSISTANTVKNNLEDSVTDANNINETLLNPTTGTIKKATDINSDLNNTIVTANTTKTNLGNIISTAQNTKTDLETSIAAGDLENYVQKTEKGMANGVATLDEKGNIPANQLNYVDTKANQAEQNANNYTDQQITLVTETGIPKLNVYEYKINADVDDSEFIIPLETFDKNTDTIRLYINTTFKDSDFYTVVNSVFENDVLIENAKIVLNTPLSCPSKVVIEVFKNIPMGEEGSVSGVVLAPNTVDDTRIGERTIDDALDPNTSNNGFITDVFNWFANRIKSITGKPSWKDAPTKNMEEINTTLSTHLNDYTQLKAELTQPDTLTTPKQTAPIISLPNAIDGQARVGVGGRIINNLLGNDGNCDDLGKWNSYGSSPTVDTNIKLFGNGSFKPTLLATAPSYVYKDYNDIGIKYYFVSAYAYLTSNSEYIGLALRSKGTFTGGKTEIADTSKLNLWQRIGFKISMTNGFRILAGRFPSQATSGNVDGIMVNEITEDEYNNLTEDELMQKYPYISGTKSTTNTRIKSVGKNLFDGELELGIFDATTGEKTDRNDAIRTKNKIGVKPNHTYALSNNKGYSQYVYYFDINHNYLNSGSTSLLFTTPQNCYYVAFRTRTATVENDLTALFQLKEGSTPTPYEPYKESISYITLPEGIDGLHSLPNGVKDEVPPDGDLIKRAKEYVLQESDVGYISTLTKIQRIWIKKPLDYLGYNNRNDYNGFLIEGFQTAAFYTGSEDNEQYENQASSRLANEFIGLILPLGTYADLTEAQQALAGTKIIYQLAEPQIYDLAITPVTCFKDGTIYIESADNAQEYVVPETQFEYPVNIAGVIQSNVEGLSRVDKVLDDLNHQYWRRIDLLTNGIEITTSVNIANATLIPLSEPYTDKKIYAAEFRVADNDTRQSQFVFFRGHTYAEFGSLVVIGLNDGIYTVRKIKPNIKNVLGFYGLSGINTTFKVFINSLYVVKEVI